MIFVTNHKKPSRFYRYNNYLKHHHRYSMYGYNIKYSYGKL